MTRIRLAAGLLGLTLMSACSVLPESEPLTTYQLPAPRLATSSQPPLPHSLRIITPAASYALQTPRIMVTPEGNTLTSYQGARWTDPNPVLLREHLVQAFQQSGSFKSVSTEVHALQTDIQLYSDLRQFQTLYQGDSVSAIIELDAKLVDPGSRGVIASRHFRVSQPLTDTAVPAVVDGLSSAADTLAQQLLDWSRTTLRQDQAQ
ncbi:ABC-type transport auxiliary lipoprotein family protein [Halopseudomonas aestusnigri]|uniref:ABC-type transport auxiliary lipoprotein family protein n=1 Tax=Halopseudomonas aestusnigri TaxID=857252 RepID=UPI002557ABDB|nr:ABC-type transport auxiliary lipoprotein family protein [Halopseudomonas aestusnigri]MDL2198517.1 ABC-type transport auxiliary lipoprotein family protein [Halopseudomonas aestusnigri]MEE2799123.1 ABC-type transport auxiliary lipoprotein family protein [Pseudomonadota bacterium]